MLCTTGYREQLEQLHREREDFGKRGNLWASWVFHKAAELETHSILDYGCGKGELNLHLPFSIDMYDPGVPKYADEPAPADIVVCTDVLEHVEPTWIDDVVEHLHACTKRVLLCNICVQPAKKKLPDGRNAHLLVCEPEWWRKKLVERGPFTLVGAPQLGMIRPAPDAEPIVYSVTMELTP